MTNMNIGLVMFFNNSRYPKDSMPKGIAKY